MFTKLDFGNRHLYLNPTQSKATIVQLVKETLEKEIHVFLKPEEDIEFVDPDGRCLNMRLLQDRRKSCVSLLCGFESIHLAIIEPRGSAIPPNYRVIHDNYEVAVQLEEKMKVHFDELVAETRDRREKREALLLRTYTNICSRAVPNRQSLSKIVLPPALPAIPEQSASKEDVSKFESLESASAIISCGMIKEEESQSSRPGSSKSVHKRDGSKGTKKKSRAAHTVSSDNIYPVKSGSSTNKNPSPPRSPPSPTKNPVEKRDVGSQTETTQSLDEVSPNPPEPKEVPVQPKISSKRNRRSQSRGSSKTTTVKSSSVGEARRHEGGNSKRQNCSVSTPLKVDSSTARALEIYKMGIKGKVSDVTAKIILRKHSVLGEMGSTTDQYKRRGVETKSPDSKASSTSRGRRPSKPGASTNSKQRRRKSMNASPKSRQSTSSRAPSANRKANGSNGTLRGAGTSPQRGTSPQMRSSRPANTTERSRPVKSPTRRTINNVGEDWIVEGKRFARLTTAAHHLGRPTSSRSFNKGNK